MFLKQRDFLKLSLFCSFFVAMLSFTPHEVTKAACVLNQKRTNAGFLASIKQKNDSVNRIVKQLLLENNQIINRILGLQSQLDGLEESIRLLEIYESIQDQEAYNESAENLKRSIKKRAYLSLGLGLLSSSLLLIGNDNGNDNVRYGGAIISLSIPIITIISMKKQLNALAPTAAIDYSLLQSGSYPHNQASKDFFRNYIKAEILSLKTGMQRLSKINVSSLDLLKSGEDEGYLRKVTGDTEYLIRQLDDYYMFQLQKFNDLVADSYATSPFDSGSKDKFQRINMTINDTLEYFREQRSKLLSNQQRINQLFE